MATGFSPGGHGTLRIIIGLVASTVSLYFIISYFERSALQKRDSCSIDLEAANREVARLKEAVDVNEQWVRADRDKAVEERTQGIRGELEAARREVGAVRATCDAQIKALRELTEGQLEALKSIPEKQAATFTDQLRIVRDECTKMIERTEKLGQDRRAECYSSAMSTARICQGESLDIKKTP
jgi:hypothetical protein